MSLLLLVRHGRTAANAAGVLAGRTPGLGLDEVGRAHAAGLRDRLAEAAIVAAVSSPLDRCRQTADIVLDGRITVQDEQGLIECDYGDWTGQELRQLRRQPLWSTIQRRPSEVTFPGGESFRAMSERAVAAIRDHAAAVDRDHGEHAVWIAFSHADVIKAVVTDAVGAPLDHLQRFVIDPCSVTAIRYTADGPLVHMVNATEPDTLSALTAAAAGPGASGSTEAVVGGGAGAQPPVPPPG